MRFAGSAVILRSYSNCTDCAEASKGTQRLSPVQAESNVSFDIDIDLNSIDLKRIDLIGIDFVDLHWIDKSYRIIYGLSKWRILNKSI